MKAATSGALRGAGLLPCVLLAAACGSSSPSPGPAQDAIDAYGPGWSAVHADAGNSDYSPVRGARRLVAAWQRQFAGSINLGPTSDERGRLYLTLNSPAGCHLFALDSATGDTVWCSAAVDRFASISSPLLDREGRLFVADSRAMHAFTTDGEPLWQAPIVGVPLSAQFTPDGHLIFITHIGRIYVLKREDGRALLPPLELVPGATYTPGEPVLACATGRPACPSANTPAIDPSGRFIFTFWTPGAATSGLRAVQYRGGAQPSLTPLWTNESLPGGSASSPTLSADGRRVYVTDNDGSLRALSTASGEEIWSFSFGYAAAGSPSRSPAGLVMPAGGGFGPVLAVWDRGDRGELAWIQEGWTNGGIPTQAAGELAYVTDLVGGVINELVVADTRSGAELERHRLGLVGFTVGTTLGLDGTVYVPSILGRLFAFRPADGEPSP